MNIDELKLIYAYDRWADWRILDACGKVSADQYAAMSPFGSLRATLVHKVDGQINWLEVFHDCFVPTGVAQDGEAKMWEHAEITEADLPTLDALVDRWQVEADVMQRYLDGLTDDDLNGIVRYAIPGGIVRERVLSHCLFHLANHGTQHRSEAAAMLTSYGASPGEMDFTLFLNHHYNLPMPA